MGATHLDRRPYILQCRIIALLATAAFVADLDLATPTAAGDKLHQCHLDPLLHQRVLKDTAVFLRTNGITDNLTRSIQRLCAKDDPLAFQQHCNCRVQRFLIENGTVYINNVLPSGCPAVGYFEHVGFLVELYEASRIYRLPDVEFFQWTGGDNAPPETTHNASGGQSLADDPAPRFGWEAGLLPLLSWSKWDENGALLVPYSGAFRCATDSFDAMAAHVQEYDDPPWSERNQTAFGRWNMFCAWYIGSMPPMPSGEKFPCARKWLHELSNAHPDLLDAGWLGGDNKQAMPLAEQRRYRYLVSTDGWSISSKLDKYLLLGSTVLKARSGRTGFYYDALQPGRHYLSFLEHNTTDILQAVRWARAHDEQARAIAANARELALRLLSRPSRLCYIFTLLQELAKHMKYRPSCGARALCVPLVDELRFLSTFHRTQHTCRWHEVLMTYGADDPDASQDEAAMRARLLLLHEDQSHWPRD